MTLRLVLGGPGCGKTTRLLHHMAAGLARGILPDQIAFLAFTKAAAIEAQQRAAEKFHLNAKRDLPWVRTIHSLCYELLGVTQDEVMKPQDWRKFGTIVNEPLSKGQWVKEEDTEDDPGVLGGTRLRGDAMLQLVDFARTTLTDLRAVWEATDHDFTWPELERFATTLNNFKTEYAKMDFTDMLRLAMANAPSLPKVRMVIVDEGQDLSAAQWAVVRRVFDPEAEWIVGGDDDQAIYRWNGADVADFLSLKGESEVLPLSHRLPQTVFALAQKVVAQIKHRYPKPYRPSDRIGEVCWYGSPEHVPLDREGSWLLLARNGYHLKDLRAMLEQQGHLYLWKRKPSVDPEHLAVIQGYETWRKGKAVTGDIASAILKAMYHSKQNVRLNPAEWYPGVQFGVTAESKIWHDALLRIAPERRMYYVACMRRGEKLTKPPRIRIETIHSVKGAEADHVMLLTDISPRTLDQLYKDPDSEHRVFYVGITRARQSLHLIHAQTLHSYSLPHVEEPSNVRA